jgi:hypothetical protein
MKGKGGGEERKNRPQEREGRRETKGREKRQRGKGGGYHGGKIKNEVYHY